MEDLESTGVLTCLTACLNRIDLWRSFLKTASASTVTEIGVWRGEFAAEMLRCCPSISTYYMIDPWAHLSDWNKPFNVSPEEFDEIYSEAIERTAFAGARRKVLRGRTLDVIETIRDQSLDFAYIDGDHTLKGIVTDLFAVLPKMKPGAVIGGDDFSAALWSHGPSYEPTLVFPLAVHVALAIRATIYALPFGQFLIRLPGECSLHGSSFVDLTGNFGSLELRDHLIPPIRTALRKWIHQFLKKCIRPARVRCGLSTEKYWHPQ